MTNPSVQSFFTPEPEMQVITALPQFFDIPDNLFPSQSHNVAVECNVTGTNFIVGEPLGVDLQVSFDAVFPHKYTLFSVEGEPVNGMDYLVNAISGRTRIQQCYIRMENTTGDFFQHWNGGAIVTFLADGQLTIKINLAMLPSEAVWNDINWETWQSYFTATVQFPDIEITSGQEIQQQRSADTNLSLTFIVLFFASVDIGVALYGYSEDKDEEKQYRYKQRKADKKRRYKHEERVYVV